MLKLRRLGRQQVQVTAWQHRYQPDNTITFLCANGRYIQLWLVSKTEKVSVLVSAEHWCRHVWPELSECAWQGLDDQTLVELFVAENKHQTLFFGHYRIENPVIITGGESSQAWLTLEEPRLGTVLLAAPLKTLTPHTVTYRSWQQITQPVDWVLGCSDISVGLLRSLALRDVLCIQQLQLHLSVLGRPLARFQKQQEGTFLVEENIDTLIATEDERLNLDEVMPEVVPVPFDMSRMTVKLTFVLGQSDIPLAELAQIQPGAVYSIGENKEREVKVYANKQLIAQGELIYIGEEGELGLEITQLAHQDSVR